MNRYVALLTLLLSVSMVAQQPAPPKPVPAPKVPPAPAAPAVPPAPPAPAVDPEQGGQPINVRLDVTVTDQGSAGVSQPKTLMVMLVDRAMGRTRAAFEDRSIAVDARPAIVGGRIRVSITVQSDANRNFALSPEQQFDPTMIWRNSFSLLLDNGKPMLVLETSDAVTKRKLSIEVKATIQK
jgi:hypothetical protein